MKLHSYQHRAVIEFCNERKGAIFMRYGSGKCLMSLTAALEIQERKGIDKPIAIIFCKKRNIHTWKAEIEKWIPWADVQDGPNAIFENIRPQILILTHHTIPRRLKELKTYIRKFQPACIIFDESTKIKNPKAKLTKAALELSNYVTDYSRLCILTGNPIPEAPYEIWSQFEFIYPMRNPFGMSFYSCLNIWFVKGDYKWVLNRDKEKEFYKILKDHCIYMLPDEKEELRFATGIGQINYTVEYYEPTSEQRAILAYLYTNWALPIELPSFWSRADKPVLHKQIDNEFLTSTMSLAMKSQEICSGFYYSKNNPTITFESPKLDALNEIVYALKSEKPSRKIIVWTKFKHEALIIRDWLSSNNYKVLVGPETETLETFAEDPQYDILVMSVGTSGGFNELVVADTCIFFSNDYSQDKRDQAEARVIRPGQTSEVINIIDIAGSGMLDHDVVTALQAKDFSATKLKALVNKYTSPRKHDG